MMGGPRGHPPGMHAEHLQAGFHEGMAQGMMMPRPPPPPPPPTSSLARGGLRPPMAGSVGAGDPWAAEFMRHEMRGPPQARCVWLEGWRVGVLFFCFFVLL